MNLAEIAVNSLKDELEATIIYGRLAKMHSDKPVSKKLAKIAEMEGRHVRFWSDFLRRRGIDPVKIKPSKLKIMLYTIIFRIIGLGLTLKLLEASESGAIEAYTKLLESPELSDEEKKVLYRILEDELVHEEEFINEESKFRDFMNHVRDAVLGMSDGLVEVLSVSAGLAGAYGNPFNVAIGGLIVGIAGALSMGIGSFTSVRAQKQVRLGVLSRILLASRYIPRLFRDRVFNYMRRKGFSIKTSKSIANEALENRELLGKIIAEEEYGLKEEALENPGKAGLYTGTFYIIGALVPLIPYFLLLPIQISIPLSFILAALMLALTGFLIAISAGLKIKWKMLELIAAGLGSAMLTYGIGKVASILLGIEVE